MSEKRTISTVSTEAKDLLSRLLASENIEVIHQEVPTAYFDVQRRVLCLPMWKDMSNDLYDMLIGHEVSLCRPVCRISLASVQRLAVEPACHEAE